MKPRDPRKVELIYKATISIVAVKGLAGLTMSGIGKETGLGMGTIYTYFKSKEQIINALFLELKEKHAQKIYAKQVKGDSFTKNFKRLFIAYFKERLEFLEENHFIDQCKTSPFLTKESIQLEERSYQEAIKLLKQGKREQIVKNIDEKLLLNFIMGGLKETARNMKKHKIKLNQKTLDTAFDLCLSTIKK